MRSSPRKRGSPGTARLLALDRGNHALKMALFDSGVIAARWREERPRMETLLRGIVRGLARESAREAGAGLGSRDRSRLERVIGDSVVLHSAVFSSVSPRWSAEIRAALEEALVSRVLEVNARIAFPFAILVDRPAKVGPDRLAAAAGVVACGDAEAIIVDAGTAITVDVLSTRGFLGGAIVPGEGLMRRSLHEGTAVLPLVPAGEAGAPPGRDTKAAIAAGAHWGAIGAVRELVRRSRHAVSRKARVYVTGGGGAAIAAGLGAEARHEPDLVFLGLEHLFELNCR